MATLGTAMDQRSVADCPGPQSGGVLRPTPTLPTLPVAAHMTSQTSAFQQPARTAAMIAEAEASLPPAPHPRDGGSAEGAGLRAELFQTTSEDELAATTVGLLSCRAGPSQLNRQRSHDSNDGHDELSRPSAPAVHASQQAILQQQMMAAYSWQMYMQAAAMQSAGGAAGMAGMAGMPMPMPMPFMPPPMFMHPDMMSAYGYAPFDFRKRPREWDGGGARRRRRHDNKVCSNCQTNSTPFWRKDRHDGSPLCNACGLYFAKNESHRPKALWKQDDYERSDYDLLDD